MKSVVDEIRNNQPNNSDKCDLVIVNPCFNNRFYQNDLVSLNSYSSDFKELLNKSKILSTPDLSSSKNLCSSFYEKISNEDLRLKKSEALHLACSLGAIDKIQKLIEKEGCDPMKIDSNGLYPIHHAVLANKIESVIFLLNNYNCSPNVSDLKQMTPLHHAASQGFYEIVKVLIQHADIDLISKNSDGKTALQLCENSSQQNLKLCSEIIKNKLNQPSKQISVRLMDGSNIDIKLISGSNTTVEQFQNQIINILGLDNESARCFSLWICSKHLKLQLKPEHKPLQHLADWKRCIVSQLTNTDPLNEEPNLVFMRDAMCSLKQEKKITNQIAIRLLCFEAYYNYIHSMYVSTEQDAIKLSIIFMKIVNDSLKIKDWIQFFKTDRKSLRIFVPLKHLFNKSASDWIKLISVEWEKSSTHSNLSKLYQKFLSHCWNFSNYGSAIFTAYMAKTNHVQVCVNSAGVHILNKQTRELEMFYPYQDLIWKIHYSPDCIEFLSKKTQQSLLVYTKQNNLINHLIFKWNQKLIEK